MDMVLDSARTRAQRAMLGLSLAQVAQVLGVTTSTYHRWEQGQPITAEKAERVALALKTGSRLARIARRYGPDPKTRRAGTSRRAAP